MRQFAFQKDMLIKELRSGFKAGTYGANVLPSMLRLAAAGYIGGEFVVWARNKVKELLSGKPAYRKDEHLTWERFLNNIAAMGTLGVISDFADWDIPLGQKAVFIGLPVQANDYMKIMASWDKFTADWQKYDDVGLAVRRNAPDAVGAMAGSFARYGLQGMKTDGQKAGALKTERGKERTTILDLIIEGKPEDGARRIDLWNKNHPEAPMTAKDVNSREVVRRAKSKARAKAEASQ